MIFLNIGFMELEKQNVEQSCIKFERSRIRDGELVIDMVVQIKEYVVVKQILGVLGYYWVYFVQMIFDRLFRGMEVLMSLFLLFILLGVRKYKDVFLFIGVYMMVMF